jgi:hypothetical protein
MHTITAVSMAVAAAKTLRLAVGLVSPSTPVAIHWQLRAT